MSFQIHALSAAPFTPLFALDDAALAARNARRMVADTCPGFPCRVSLQDTPQGATVLLLNHLYQPARSPYRARHAIFVCDGATQAHPDPDEVPQMLASRQLAARFFDQNDMMVDAALVDGAALAPLLATQMARSDITYGQIHFAARGCFAARVTRA